MDPLSFTAIIFSVALAAGFLGSLTGLGGGVILTPVLTLMLGVDLRYAIGATLVSVIATSSGAASAYVREGYSNVRIGMLLEVATTAGAIAGASAAGYVSTGVLGVIFGVVLLHSAWLSSRKPPQDAVVAQVDPLAQRLQLDGCYPTAHGPSCYHVQHVRTGFSLMFGAGLISGLLGIGSGALKVIAMDRAMRIPFKVSTTTSNFMIGVTAAASAGVYLNRGYIAPLLAMPVMLGVLAGSLTGARVMAKASPVILRKVFALLVGLLAVQMIIGALRGEDLTTERMDGMIGILLRVGVLLSAATTLAGGIWHLAQHGASMPDYHVFHGEPAQLHNISGVLAGIARGQSESLVQLGLLLLIATPIARVALSVAAFAIQRDRTYVAITALVLAVLIASLAGYHF